MSDPLFLLDELADPLPVLGATVELGGPEGRHASVVRRVRPGESMLRDVELPQHGTIKIVIGPEGGVAPAELDALAASGGRQVLVSDGVLRTSTAGVVALAGLLFR